MRALACLVGGVVLVWVGQDLIDNTSLPETVGYMSLFCGCVTWFVGASVLIYDTVRD
jgi:hypothetical protein